MEESGANPLANACPDCGATIDVSGYMPYEKIACPECGAHMRVRVQFDHYRIRELRGVGGMSQVFVALDSHLNRHVALKVLNRENSTKDDRISQFEREARLTASISHPNVVRVYGVGYDQGNLYIAMELVDGASLEEMLGSSGKLEEAQVLDLAIEATEGLAAAFRVGLIHRDIKPGNILLTAEGQAKLVDFGLALVFEKDVDDSDEMWATPYYVPPEKLSGGVEDFRSDIYSLGSTFFHLLAGRPPYDAPTASVEELREIKSRPVRLGAFAPMVSEATQKVIDRMMELRQEDRFQSYDELLAALRDARQALLESLGMARPASREIRRGEMRRKARMRMILAGGAIGIAAVALVAWKMRARPVEEATEAGGGNGGEGWEVGTLESGNVGERFLQARQTMKEGKLEEAKKQFLGIFEDANTRQPTVNWAAASVVLVDLLAGEPGQARAMAARMAKDARFRDGRSGEAGVMFHKMVEHLQSPWPVPLATLEEMKKSRGWEMQALLVGLKNWEHGRFADAAGFLDAVRAAQLPKELDWISDLGGVLGKYTLDAGTLAGLNTKDDFVRSSDVESAITECQTALAQIRTEGRAKRWMEARIQHLGERRDRMSAEEKSAEEKEANERTAKELEQLRALAARLSAFRSGYRFDEAVIEIRAFSPSTPAGKDAHANVLWLWQGAAEFLAVLASDINQSGYRGNIQPKENGVVYTDIVIQKASKTTLVVTGRLGLINVPIPQVPPGQLAVLAAAMLEKQSADAEAGVLRRGLLARFFLALGSMADAQKAIAGLPENQEFAARWKSAVEMSGPATSVGP